MKAVVKKQEATQCKPTEHMFMALDITPSGNHGNAMIGQLGYSTAPRQYIVFCSKCAAVKRIV